MQRSNRWCQAGSDGVFIFIHIVRNYYLPAEVNVRSYANDAKLIIHESRGTRTVSQFWEELAREVAQRLC